MFHGSIPALVTPFTASGEVDFAAFAAFVDWQVTSGSAALAPCGTTGESATLTIAEHDAVVAKCIEVAAGRVPVIAGCGSNDTAVALAHMRHAQAAGASAALVVCPYYNKPSQAGLLAHYTYLATHCDLPIVIYNIPGRSVVDMSVETMARLAELPTIVGVKDATGNLGRVPAQRAACGTAFAQLSGNDDMALGFNAMGGGRLHLGERQRRAGAVRRVPGGDGGRRSRCRAGAPGSAVAAPRRAVRRRQPRADQVRPRPPRPDGAEHPPADHPAVGCRPRPRRRRARSRRARRCRRHDESRLMARPALTTGVKAKIVAENRRARYEYFIDDVVEAGIALAGTEVKALRTGEGSIAEAYAELKDGQMWLVNANIPEFSHGNRFNHEPKRPRKLLLHARQISRMNGAVTRQGMTLIPLMIYFNDRGRAKVELALAKGKKLHDKRDTEKARDWKRDAARIMRDRG